MKNTRFRPRFRAVPPNTDFQKCAFRLELPHKYRRFRRGSAAVPRVSLRPRAFSILSDGDEFPRGLGPMRAWTSIVVIGMHGAWAPGIPHSQRR